jgi:hypothetical protein
MATKTPILSLILPANGEYVNSWNIPVNTNFQTIDTVVGGLQTELDASAGSLSDLATRLAVSINEDGTLIPTPELVDARDSSVYGYASATAPFLLNDRLEQADREIFNARQGLANLSAIAAWANDSSIPNCIVSAPPGFLNFTGAQVFVNGATTPVVANINGFRQVARTQLAATVSGAAGTYYIYLGIQAGGFIYLDHTSALLNTGVTGTYAATGLLQQFTDTTVNFVLAGVQPGDVLDITSVGSANANRYVVLATSVQDPVNLTVNSIAIISQFSSAQSSLNYKFTDLISPSLNVTATPHALSYQEVPGRAYIGRAVFDGTNVTSVYNYAINGVFEQFFSVALVGGAFSQAIAHQLGFFPSEIQFFASQANDWSMPIEPLSTDAATGGSTTLVRSVVTQVDDQQILVKNATSGVFYLSYGGTTWTTGYLLVRAHR